MMLDLQILVLLILLQVLLEIFFEDEMMTITDTLAAIRSTRPRTTLVVIRDVEEEPSRATPIPIVQSQDKVQRNKIRNKPPTRAQLRNKMVTYLKHMGKYTYNQMKSKSFKEIQKLYEREQKWINDFVLIDSEVVKDSRKGKDEGSRKKIVARKRTVEKLDDERDDEAVNVESLATKYIIVDWKTHALSEDKMYYEIIRGDGSTKSYKIFTEMLDDFDRQDVLDLYRLVKERFETASPEGYDRLLWGDLITVFEPIHVLLMDTGIAIHMLIEKTYPLTQEMLSRMLSRRLEVDHECEMAYELLRGGLLGIRGFYDLMLLVQVCAAAED
ncbi:hypothetical protein Tco_0675038 [Tanacetum coccineum]